jgi:hypothetical protein
LKELPGIHNIPRIMDKLFFPVLVYALFLGLIGCTVKPEEASSFKSIFDHYRQVDGITAISFPPSLIGLFLSEEDTDQAEMKKLMQELSAFRMLVLDSQSGREDLLAELRSNVTRFTSRREYQDLFRMQTADEDIFIRILEKNDIVSNVVLMITADDRFFVMQLKGNIQLKHLTRLVEGGYIEDLTGLSELDF